MKILLEGKNVNWDYFKKIILYLITFVSILIVIEIWLTFSDVIFTKLLKLPIEKNSIHFLEWGWLSKNDPAIFHQWLLALVIPIIVTIIILLSLKGVKPGYVRFFYISLIEIIAGQNQILDRKTQHFLANSLFKVLNLLFYWYNFQMVNLIMSTY